MTKQAFKGIPPDDWFWNEKEKKFTLLSDDEIDRIVQAVDRVQLDPTTSDYINAINWAIIQRTGEKLLKGVLCGRLSLQIPKKDSDRITCIPEPLPDFNEEEEDGFEGLD